MTSSFPESTSSPSGTGTLLPLDRIILIASLASVATGMAAFTIFEYATGSAVSASELLTHHLLPAILIGAVVWAVLGLLLHRSVIAPVKAVSMHLYRIGSGRLEPLELGSRVSEIRAAIDGVNLLARRIKAAPDDLALDRALDRVMKLRSDLAEISGPADNGSALADPLVPVMRDLCSLEADLLAVAVKTGKRS